MLLTSAMESAMSASLSTSQCAFPGRHLPKIPFSVRGAEPPFAKADGGGLRWRFQTLDLAVQPSLGKVPVAVGGAAGQPESGRRLLDGQPGKAMELDQLGRRRVALGQSGQRLIKQEEVLAGHLE